jgi:tetratricopeptide (TPR) repeat protein
MKFTTTALALVLTATAGSAYAQYGMPAPPTNQQPTRTEQQDQSDQAKKPGVTPSNKARKALIELQKAVDANDTATIPAKLAEAEAVASTKEDHYLIGNMRLKAAVAAKDNAAMAAAVDAIAASGYESPAKIARLYMAVGSHFYEAKQPAQAIPLYQKGLALDPQSVDLLINLGEAQSANGNKAEAVATFQRAIQVRTAAGQKPQEALYKTALSIAYDAKLPATGELSRQWVAAYPTTESWRNAIAIYRNESHQDVEGTLDLLRLMQATGSLSTAGDYRLFMESAAEQSNYNEAQAVLDAGIAAKVVNPSDPSFRDDIAGIKAKPKATAADLEEALKSSPSAINVIRIGDRFYAMGNYSRAAEIYRQALSRSGVDSGMANLHLGMALARGGDKAGATAALNAVTGPLAEIAKFWLIYVKQHG